MIIVYLPLILLALLIVALPVALLLGVFVRSQPARRNAQKTALVSGVLLALILGGGFVAMRAFFGPPPPSLAELKQSFTRERGDLETLVKMTDADREYGRIAPDWVSRFPVIDKHSGQINPKATDAPMPSPRWDAYRSIFRRNDIELGTDRNLFGDVFIMVASEGLLNRGHASGYLYCNPSPPDLPDLGFRFEPCISDKDADSHRQQGSDEAYSFIKLQDHWFAYDQGPS